MTGNKKASNGTSQGRRSKSASVPPVQPPTSDAAVPSSDSIALPGPSSKKLFPLFDSRSKKTNGKTSSSSQANSDVESTTGNMSEGSQASTAQKGKKKATAAVNGTAKAKVKGDASSNTVSSAKASQGSNSTKEKKSSKKFKSRSPLIDDIDIHDLDITTSTVASTSTSHTTPPPQPHKTVITITDSPVRELKPIKTFADLNAERQAKKAAKEAGGWNGGRPQLWPTRENMHVPPIDYHTSHEERTESQNRDWKGKGRAVEAHCLLDNDEQTRRYASIAQTDTSAILQRFASFEGSLQADPSSSSSAAQEAKSILDEATLKRLKAVAEDDTAERPQQTWYQRYAPMRAADVLGDMNKENAFYLRDWLRELTLQDASTIINNLKKRKIKREITSDERKRLRRAAKRRKRKGYDGTGFEEDSDNTLEDFIAADDEVEYDHYDYYNLSDVDAGNGSSLPPSPTKSTTSTSSHQGPSHYGRFEPLTNVILLSGPVASGKTSTAYAVANELNWQVFEVYPGIGKRGYKDLERYVGMVGENHIMKRETNTAAAAAAPAPISSFFGKAAASTSTSTSQTSQSTKAQPSNGIFKQKAFVGAASNNTASTSNGTMSGGSRLNDSNTVKQSCILIEEVDNLYESDSGFWEGLISFISKSRRPVILTCNDFNHSIPKDSLPLQNILLFESATKEMGRILLSEIARLEDMSRATDEGNTTLENGKQKKTISDEDVEEIIKMASDSAGQVDLRLAINQLQYIASCPSNTTASKLQPSTNNANNDLRLVQTILDNASFADAELRRRDWLSLQDDESVAQPGKEDDEFLQHRDLPIHKLDPPREADLAQPLPCYAREAEFCAVFGVMEDEDDDELEVLVDEQWRQCTNLQPAVDELLDESTLLRPSDHKIHLDVLPMLRDMVLNDDVHEIAYNVALEITSEDAVLDSRIRRSRRLAGTGKEGYRRHLDMSKEVVECLKGSGIRLKVDQDEGEEEPEGNDLVEGRGESHNDNEEEAKESQE